MSVAMIATKAFTYAGRRLAAGASFEARGESDARVLEAIRNARRDLQVPRAITDPEPVPVAAPKRGRGYRKQALQAQASSDAAPESMQPGASEVQASEQGTGDTPGVGSAETPSAADDAAAPATGRPYRRRDLAGAPE
ncbi:MAG: hypothetical protein BWZ09_01404 [Alphaproteobacteria bacterium ADurb.BinA305]|nr:MAG: hypothetical protein BWZ09_01404 [Alphaproteobacteria bacterium ADurb.BinA305]